jgi:hypothetical protein
MPFTSRNSARQAVHQVAKKKRIKGFRWARRSALVTGLPSTPLKLNDGKSCPGFRPTAGPGVGCARTVGVRVGGAGVDEARRTVVFVGATVGLATVAPDTAAVAGADVVAGVAERGMEVAGARVDRGATVLAGAGTIVGVIGAGWPFRGAVVGTAAGDPQADASRANAPATARRTSDRRDGWACSCRSFALHRSPADLGCSATRHDSRAQRRAASASPAEVNVIMEFRAPSSYRRATSRL